MTKKERSSKAYACLRGQAEERIKQWPRYEINKLEDLHELIHELKIHLAEQEIMNEELRRTMNLMEDGKKNK